MKSTIKLEIIAGKASLQPPIGPILGQYGIPGAKFCQEFNDQTKHFQDDLILSVKIHQLHKKIIHTHWSPNFSKLLQRFIIDKPPQITISLISQLSSSSQSLSKLNSLSINSIMNSINQTIKFKGILNQKRYRQLNKRLRKLKTMNSYILIEDVYVLAMVYMDWMLERGNVFNVEMMKGMIKQLISALRSMQVYIIKQNVSINK